MQPSHQSLNRLNSSIPFLLVTDTWHTHAAFLSTEQFPHMDIKDGNGSSIWMPIAEDQEIDIWPDSEKGIETIDELEPLYEEATEYYKDVLHEEWLTWNPGESLQSGIASFWAFIVDRQFRKRGVSRIWKRYRILVKAGQGLIIKNRLLHAGAPHSGGPDYRIHMYMAEGGKLLADDLGEAAVSDRVYDFRTDEVYFPLAFYLEAGRAGWVNLTSSTGCA